MTCTVVGDPIFRDWLTSPWGPPTVVGRALFLLVATWPVWVVIAPALVAWLWTLAQAQGRD